MLNHRKHYLWRAFVDFLFNYDEKIASPWKHAHFKARVQKSYPIIDQNGQSRLQSIPHTFRDSTYQGSTPHQGLCSYDNNHVTFIPNRTFLVRFGGTTGEFGRAMVRILARRSRAKIPMVRLNEPDMPPKRTKKVRLGIYRTQIRM